MFTVQTDRELTLTGNEDSPKSSVSYIQVLQSKIIMFRLVICCFCWMAILFTYYGLTLDSVSIGGNRYVNFILMSLVEIPASVVSLWVPDIPALGRRWTTAGSFFISGAACWAFWLIDEEDEMWDNVLILTGKFCSTLTIAVIYLYTAEIFPTELRTSLLAVCSTVGRLGPLFVPQIPLLADYMNPMILFGAVSMLGGLLILGCPETLNTKLPDTIEEAENIGKTPEHLHT
uniref:Major facilitator superfamily (MFS) profile domain-containing protein n=1 Tax=Graphocephala atropunctata TaxID=36148 RepID=A0A1B6ML33_9HEMI